MGEGKAGRRGGDDDGGGRRRSDRLEASRNLRCRDPLSLAGVGLGFTWGHGPNEVSITADGHAIVKTTVSKTKEKLMGRELESLPTGISI